MARLLREASGQLTDAMAADMGKPAVEAWLTDVAAVRKDVEGIERHLESWASPRRVRVPWPLRPGRAEVVPEPLGAVLVIGPWNYPVRCTVLPLAFALAAGNTVAVKPSELAPATSALLCELLASYVDGAAVATAPGGPEVAQELLSQKWDHIFFTGGARVGRLVMAAAAEHLTPVTLELGGKNPAIVDRTADLERAARRLVWGKFLNAGQTCVAPDYVAVEHTVAAPLLAALVKQVCQMFGNDPRRSTAFGRIVNEDHLARLVALLARTKGRTITGGTSEPVTRYLAPTIVADVDWADPLMEDEIFGPVLPVLAYRTIDELIGRINSRDKPLALYLYSQDAPLVDRVLAATSSGGVCVNHNAVQLAVPGLPFGGVGASGIGAYHGRAGFDTFSHAKAVLRKPQRAELPLMYPPYGRLKRWVLRKAM